MKDADDGQNDGFAAQLGAVAADVEAGLAIFAQDPPGRIFQMVLPKQARLRNEEGAWEHVLIVQAETHSTFDDVIVGYKTREGSNGVALLDEIDFG